MDSKLRTSFIPKQEVLMSNRLASSGSRFSILSIVAISVFSISVILAISVFIYQRSLVQNLNDANAKLVAMKTSFEPGFIDEIVKLDQRIRAAETIVANHNVVTPIFDLLEKETVQGIRFDNLNYSVDAAGQPSINMKGEAVNFLAIASQSDVFGADKRIIKPVFSGLNLDDKGVANFAFSGDLDSKSFLYKDIVNSGTGTTTGQTN